MAITSHRHLQKESISLEDSSGENILSVPVFHYDVLSSVLDVAHEHIAQNELPIWGSVLATSQTQGRGQLRRLWESPPGNLYAALRLPEEAPFTQEAAAPAVGALLAEVLCSLGLDVYLKWPNDIVVLHEGMPHKIGGILLEERGGRILAGIGINIVSAPSATVLRQNAAMPAGFLKELPEFKKDQFGNDLATSLPALPRSLWHVLVKKAFLTYREKSPYPMYWRPFAETRLLWKGKMVVWEDEGKCVSGRLLGLGDSGGIRLELGMRVDEVMSGGIRRIECAGK